MSTIKTGKTIIALLVLHHLPCRRISDPEIKERKKHPKKTELLVFYVSKMTTAKQRVSLLRRQSVSAGEKEECGQRDGRKWCGQICEKAKKQKNKIEKQRREGGGCRWWWSEGKRTNALFTILMIGKMSKLPSAPKNKFNGYNCFTNSVLIFKG